MVLKDKSVNAIPNVLGNCAETFAAIVSSAAKVLSSDELRRLIKYALPCVEPAAVDRLLDGLHGLRAFRQFEGQTKGRLH